MKIYIIILCRVKFYIICTIYVQFSFKKKKCSVKTTLDVLVYISVVSPKTFHEFDKDYWFLYLWNIEILLNVRKWILLRTGWSSKHGKPFQMISILKDLVLKRPKRTKNVVNEYQGKPSFKFIWEETRFIVVCVNWRSSRWSKLRWEKSYYKINWGREDVEYDTVGFGNALSE